MEITTEFIITLLHELGHAIPAKLFTKHDTEIILGSNNKHDKSIFTIPSLGILPKISVKSLSPYGTTFNKPIKNRLYNGIITTAGPISGFIGGLGLSYGFSHFGATGVLPSLWSSAGATASTHNAKGTLLNLVPSDSSSDGYYFAKDVLNLSKKNLKAANSFGTYALKAITLFKATSVALKICYNFLQNNDAVAVVN